jgi:methionyl-tRNA synthetase
MRLQRIYFLKMYNEGLFDEKETEQYYDEKANTFLADRYIIGTCPVCRQSECLWCSM